MSKRKSRPSKYNSGPIIVVRTSEEVDSVINQAADQIIRGCSKFSGMSYEEGVRTALEWITGDIDDDPMND
jgi:hypothetical protein